MTLEVADLDLADLVLDVAARHRDQAAQGGCVLDVVAPSIVGRWDRLGLDQVLTSLMGNALEYRAGRPVTVRAASAGPHVLLEVRDRGIGLAREDASRIFRKFERAVSPADYGGLGLGLYITHQLVEAHGGRIEIDSALGAGATFRVTLPRVAPPIAS